MIYDICQFRFGDSDVTKIRLSAVSSDLDSSSYTSSWLFFTCSTLLRQCFANFSDKRFTSTILVYLSIVFLPLVTFLHHSTEPFILHLCLFLHLLETMLSYPVLPTVTNIINLFLSTGIFPDQFKNCSVHPHLNNLT